MKPNRRLTITLLGMFLTGIAILPPPARSQDDYKGTLLQVKRPPGSTVTGWGAAAEINSRQMVTLRWLTFDTNASTATWQLSEEDVGTGTNVPLSKVLASGSAGANVPAVKYKEFNIDFAQLAFVPQTPTKTPKDYWVRLVPYDANRQIGSISVSVKITYVAGPPKITAIKPTPHGTFAEIFFRTATPAIPIVEASTKAPGAGPAFTAGDVQSSAFPLLAGYQKTHSVRLDKLTPGTTFHYVIKVKDQNGKEARKTGTLTTLNRRVAVTFSEIYIKDDSDDLSEGDFDFGFYLNGTQFLGAKFDLDTGKTKLLSAGKFTATLTNPSEPLDIRVFGNDDDEIEFGGSLPIGGLNGNGKKEPYKAGDAAVGGKPFNFVTGPEEVFTQAFTIKSNPAKLKFEVKGTISVTYVP